MRRRDGSMQSVEKLRGFLNYQRNPEPYRDPLVRVTDWEEINPVPERDVGALHHSPGAPRLAGPGAHPGPDP